MKERLFVQKTKEHIGLEEYIRKYFKDAKCGHIEVQHTPIVTRIIIYTVTPGLVIGSGGEKIKEIIEKLKQDFKLENPQVDVQKIDKPDMDPNIIAQNIVRSLETGTSYKRLGKYYVSRIMNAGAIGCEIVLSGKFSGQRARTERFAAGYLKKCGEPAERDVIRAFAVANPKLGNVGVTVKIMIRHPKLALEKEEKKEEVVKEERPRMGFHEDVVPQVFKGKTKTYRLRNHMLQIGFEVDFENSGTGDIFGKGIIKNIEYKAIKEIDLKDPAHGTTYENTDELIASLKKYNPEIEITAETNVIVYTFEFIPKEE